jgi:hypothetical protein
MIGNRSDAPYLPNRGSFPYARVFREGAEKGARGGRAPQS